MCRYPSQNCLCPGRMMTVHLPVRLLGLPFAVPLPWVREGPGKPAVEVPAGILHVLRVAPYGGLTDGQSRALLQEVSGTALTGGRPAGQLQGYCCCGFPGRLTMRGLLPERGRRFLLLRDCGFAPPDKPAGLIELESELDLRIIQCRERRIHLLTQMFLQFVPAGIPGFSLELDKDALASLEYRGFPLRARTKCCRSRKTASARARSECFQSSHSS